MIEVLLFAMALGSDAFVVAFVIGMQSKKDLTLFLAFRVAFIFALGQGVMPFLGHILSDELSQSFQIWIPWISAMVLVFLGINMWIESLHPLQEKKINIHSLKVIILLAFATSIDAIAAGFTLNQFSLSPYMSIVLMMICTFILSAIGLYFGDKGKNFLGNYAEQIGAVILMIMAFKMII